MAKIITIFEHSQIQIEEKRDLKKGILSRKDLDYLLSIKLENKSVFKFKSSKTLKTTSIVGSIALKDGVIIEILPKIAKEDRVEEYRKEFVKLIRFTDKKNSFVSSSTSSKVSIKELPLISYVVELFAENLLEEIRRSADKDYTKVVESHNIVRGKINMQKTLTKHPFDRSKVVIEYRKRTENTNLMRVFKSVSLLLLEDRTFSYRAKQNLFEIRNLLQNVEKIELRESDFERVQFSRLNSRFETLFNQARTIFYNYMPYTAKIDSTPFWSILFDMNVLFEKFVEELFKKSKIQFSAQKSFQIYDKVKIMPDIVLNDFVVDTKYKIYDERPKREDIFQLLSYVSTLNKKKGYLIAPTFEDRENLNFSPKIGGKDFEVIFINIGLGIDEVVKSWRFEISDELKFSKLKKPFKINGFLNRKEKDKLFETAKEEKNREIFEELARVGYTPAKKFLDLEEVKETIQEPKIETKSIIKLSSKERGFLKKLYKNYRKGNALGIASENNELKIVQHLIINEKVNVNSRLNHDVTALMIASTEGNKEIAKLLLEHGADPNLKTKTGGTSLNLASMKGNKEIVKLLLEHGANPNLKDETGENTLSFLFDTKNVEIVKLLLEYGADPNLQNINNGKTVLMRSSHEQNIKVVKLLLEYGANPNLQDKDGRTALDVAKILGETEIVKILQKAMKIKTEKEENLLDLTIEKEKTLFDETDEETSLSFKEIAIKVLREANRMMFVSEIFAKGKHLYSGNGKTPENSLSAILGESVKNNENIFYRIKEKNLYKYGLVENKKPEVENR
jgi:5-methylcytosine-specific restriction endonuclease McrBC regulatory subunit McrC/ankyrin repeat protein